MNVSDLTRKFIVLGFSLFIIIGIIAASIMGKKQDTAFQIDDIEYNNAVSQLQEGNYAGVLEGTIALKSRQKSSEPVNYLIALAAGNVGEVEESLKYMQRTLDINPYKVEDSLFMLQYAEFLVMADLKEKAELVLEKCVALSVPESYPQYKERVAQLQQQLAAQS